MSTLGASSLRMISDLKGCRSEETILALYSTVVKA
jgi:hypothetical protein